MARTAETRDSAGPAAAPPFGAVTRVQIVDDHHIFADLLALALDGEPDLECVGTASTMAGAIALALRERPGVIVMDIQLRGENGLDATRRIRDLLPDVIIVVVSAHSDPNWVVKAAQAGASAFAPKSGSLTELLAVIRTAGPGTMLVAASLYAQVAGTLPEPRQSSERLTAREQEVLTLMGQGVAPAQIAMLLNISLNTCRGYVKSIHSRLGVRSQLEAVVKAQRLGLIQATDDRR
jgi:DNA-binding NarL/FixJ family response regulator